MGLFIFILVGALVYVRQTESLPVPNEDVDEGKMSIKKHADALDLWIDGLPPDLRDVARKLHAQWSRRAVAREKELLNNLNLERGTVRRLSETISLIPLRNRIDDLETRFGVGGLQVGELSQYLQDTGYDVSKMIADLREYSADKTKKMDSARLKQTLIKLEKASQKDVNRMTGAIGKDPIMSNTLAEKASVHSLRFKYIFMRHAADPDVQLMMKEVQKVFGGDVDKLCREVGYLFIKLSTVGVHLLPATIDGVPINVDLIRRGLVAHGIGDSNTLNVVDVLYSTFEKN